MKTWAIAAALLWPLSAAAESLPARFSVTGVAADDVLNIRAEPTAGSQRLGDVAPDRTDLEVLELSADGRWGLVGLAEGNGWVAMRFLARKDAAEGVIPRPLRCLGTEPFWSVRLSPDTATYSTPDESRGLSLISGAVAAEGYLAFLTDDAGAVWTMTVARARCSDGMSARIYGWTGLIFAQGADGNRLLQGCCTLDGG